MENHFYSNFQIIKNTNAFAKMKSYMAILNKVQYLGLIYSYVINQILGSSLISFWDILINFLMMLLIQLAVLNLKHWKLKFLN